MCDYTLRNRVPDDPFPRKYENVNGIGEND